MDFLFIIIIIFFVGAGGGGGGGGHYEIGLFYFLGGGVISIHFRAF